MTSVLASTSSPLRSMSDPTSSSANNGNPLSSLLLSPDGVRPAVTEPVVHPAAIPRDREENKKRVFGRSNSVLVDPIAVAGVEASSLPEPLKAQKSSAEEDDAEDRTRLTWAPMKPSRKFAEYNNHPESLKDLRDAFLGE